jgi:hypothetical protein
MGTPAPINVGDLVVHVRMDVNGVVLSKKNQTLTVYRMYWLTDTGWMNQAPMYVTRDEIMLAEELTLKEKNDCFNKGLCGRCLQLGGGCRNETR